VPILSEARHQGALTSHESVLDEFSTHKAANSGVVWKEAGAMFITTLKTHKHEFTHPP
jgi:hypothetical protein